MALAMAGILAPIADATNIVETTDYSNTPSSPTNPGPFNPASDAILGTLNNSGDNVDAIRIIGTPNAPTALPFSFNATAATPFLFFGIYDEGDLNNFLGGNTYSSLTGSETFNFSVPADGDYVMYLSLSTEDAAAYSYTIGTVVPEPGTSGLLAAVAGVTAALRRRKSTQRND